MDWYPTPTSGWHAGLALEGWLITSAAPAGAARALIGVAPGAMVSGGYDLWIRRRWSFGLIASAMALPSPTLRDTNGAAFQVTPLQFTLGADLLFQ